MKKHALWVGRFQPPTNAHMATLETIMQSWKKATIGIIVRTVGIVAVSKRWLEFLERTAETTMSESRNPFSGDEIKEMWKVAVKGKSMKKNVDFQTMPQIGYQADFAKRFPEDVFDFVEVEYGDAVSKADKLRRKTFECLLGRKIHFVRPPYFLHTSDIRVLIKQGRNWSDFLPSGMLKLFHKLGGVERMKA